MVLCGLAGIGKTTAAVAYAHRHLSEVGIAWQFNCEDPEVLAAGFGQLAAELRGGDMHDIREPALLVHATLAASQAEWLLIFDNAADSAAVRTFLPPAGPGRILITSRNPLWPPGQVLEVPALDTENAAAFLISRTGDPDWQVARKLADELGGLPLALEQVSAYTQATGGRLAGALESFRQHRADLLARGEPIGYHRTVAATWSLAFEQLQDRPDAVGLMRLLASYAPEAIPLPLLLHSRPGLIDQLAPEVAPVLGRLMENPWAAKDAVAALRRYSLISPAADGSVSVHRLVQAVTADQMDPDSCHRWRQAAATLIEAAIPEDTDPPETWPVCAALLPHALAALSDDSVGMGRLANYLGQQGSYASALELQKRHLDALDRVLGPEHPHTLTARASLTRWTGRAGDAAVARVQFTALLPVMDRVLGPEDMETLRVRAGLADWTGQAGDAAGARDQFTALLPVMRPGTRSRGHGDLEGPRWPRRLDRAGGGRRRGP